MLLRGKLPFLLKRLADSSSLNMQPPEPTCADSGGWLMPNKGSLFVSRQVFYLVDDVLILALGLEVNRETNNGSTGIQRLFLHALHAQRDALATEVDANDADADMLMQADNLSGVGDVTVGQLGNVDESVLMNTDIDEGSEVGDVGDDARQLHAFAQVVNGLHAGVELELLNLFARVAPGFLQLVHDVGKGGESDVAGHISLYVNLCTLVGLADKVGDGAMTILGHLLHNAIALRMNSRVVEWVLGIRDAQESGTLLIGGRTQAGHLLQLCTRGEGSVLFPVIHNVLRQYGT